MRAAKRLLSLPVLQPLFYSTLLLRFSYPFFFNPMDRLFSDPERHWQNGANFLKPTHVGGLDPKLYQAWLYLVRGVSRDDRILVALFTGLLCAAMAYFWYRCLREMFHKRDALLVGILIGLCPSLTSIYAYFMNETLLLPLLGLSFWMSLRAARKKTLPAFSLAAASWLLAILSRGIALPFALLALPYILRHQEKKLMAGLTFAAMSLVALVPAGMHSLARVHVFAPLGYLGMNGVNRYTGTTVFSYTLEDGEHYLWSSPAYYTNPFDPVGGFATHRKAETYRFKIDTRKGRADWKRERRRLRKAYTLGQHARDYLENAVFLLFGPSWPDSPVDGPSLMMRLNNPLRWLWPPAFLLLLLYAPFYRGREGEVLAVAACWLVTLYMLLQDSVMLEGRYRKPLEPFLVIGVFVFLNRLLLGRVVSKDGPGGVSPAAFVYETYLQPCLALAAGERPWAAREP